MNSNQESDERSNIIKLEIPKPHYEIPRSYEKKPTSDLKYHIKKRKERHDKMMGISGRFRV